MTEYKAEHAAFYPGKVYVDYRGRHDPGAVELATRLCCQEQTDHAMWAEHAENKTSGTQRYRDARDRCGARAEALVLWLHPCMRRPDGGRATVFAAVEALGRLSKGLYQIDTTIRHALADMDLTDAVRQCAESLIISAPRGQALEMLHRAARLSFGPRQEHGADAIQAAIRFGHNVIAEWEG